PSRYCCFCTSLPPPRSTLFPYTTRFRSKYRPDPKYLDVSGLADLVRRVGDHAVVLHNFPGVWYEACSVRDLVSVSTDVYERPERSEEHTSELQSRENLVCRLLLEKKNST